MSDFEGFKERLRASGASLVILYKNGEAHDYYGPGISDIKEILHAEKGALLGAAVFDKVIGKTPAGLLALSGVSFVYGEVMSRAAAHVFERLSIPYEYGTLVDFVQNKDKTDMCPMERRYKDEDDLQKIYREVMENAIKS